MQIRLKDYESTHGLLLTVTKYHMHILQDWNPCGVAFNVRGYAFSDLVLTYKTHAELR